MDQAEEENDVEDVVAKRGSGAGKKAGEAEHALLSHKKKNSKPKVAGGGAGHSGAKGAEAGAEEGKKWDASGRGGPGVILSDAKWLALGDEVVELLRDGPLAEQSIFEKIGTRETKRKKKQMVLQRLVDGDFVIRQGAGTLGG